MQRHAPCGNQGTDANARSSNGCVDGQDASRVRLKSRNVCGECWGPDLKRVGGSAGTAVFEAIRRARKAGGEDKNAIGTKVEKSVGLGAEERGRLRAASAW